MKRRIVFRSDSAMELFQAKARTNGFEAGQVDHNRAELVPAQFAAAAEAWLDGYRRAWAARDLRDQVGDGTTKILNSNKTCLVKS